MTLSFGVSFTLLSVVHWAVSRPMVPSPGRLEGAIAQNRRHGPQCSVGNCKEMNGDAETVAGAGGQRGAVTSDEEWRVTVTG
jgi:hypothetical protein